MNILIPVLYDGLAILLLLLSISRGSAKGFARTTVDVLGHIAAFFTALIVGKGLASMIYAVFIGRPVYGFLEEHLTGAIENGEMLQNMQAALEELPTFVSHFFGGISQYQLENAMSSAVSEFVAAIEQSVVRPAVTTFVYIILFFIIFGVLCFFVKRLASGVGFVFKAPLLRPIDRFLGGCLGLLQGGITLYLLAMAAHFILYFLQEPPMYFNESVISATYIWDWVYHFNPFQFLQ